MNLGDEDRNYRADTGETCNVHYLGSKERIGKLSFLDKAVRPHLRRENKFARRDGSDIHARIALMSKRKAVGCFHRRRTVQQRRE